MKRAILGVLLVLLMIPSLCVFADDEPYCNIEDDMKFSADVTIRWDNAQSCTVDGVAVPTDSFKVTTDGAHTVVLVAYNGDVYDYTFYVDKTDPTCTAKFSNGKCTIKITDANGIRSASVNNVYVVKKGKKVNQSTYSASISGNTVTVVCNAGKKSKFTVEAYDNFGNSLIYGVANDTAKPTLLGYDEDKRVIYTKAKKSVVLKARDNISPANSCKVYVDGALLAGKNPTVTGLVVTGSSNRGGYTVVDKQTTNSTHKIKVVDGAGNSRTYTWYSDSEKPTATGTLNGKKVKLLKGKAYKSGIKVFGRDVGSGVASVKLDGKTIKRAKALTAKGKHTIIVKDKCGNSRTVTFKIK